MELTRLPGITPTTDHEPHPAPPPRVHPGGTVYGNCTTCGGLIVRTGLRWHHTG